MLQKIKQKHYADEAEEGTETTTTNAHEPTYINLILAQMIGLQQNGIF